jgi:hypothetical protein
MKKTLFLLSIILSHLAIAAEFKFRVQCATSKEKQFTDIIQKIPELSPYMMPNGEKIYFSGKYFNEYSKAEKRLNQVLALGFCNAEIRVFKDNQYLLHVLSAQYLPVAIAQNNKKEEMNRVEAELMKIKATQNLNTNKIVFKPSVLKENNSAKNVHTNTKSVIESDIKKNTSLQKNNSIIVNTIAIEDKKVERKIEQKENKMIISPTKQKFSDVGQKINTEMAEVLQIDLKDTSSLLDFVDELPSFKIQLVKAEKGTKAVELVNNLLETVYQYETPQSLILTVGYYKESSLAQPKVMHYVIEGYPEAKVVGIFKGYVVSKELAEDLLYFYTYKKSKNLSLN